MIRLPAVANQFYPGDPALLNQTISQLTPEQAKPSPAHAIIAPHAGYIYSGKTAALTFAETQIPENIIILGPNHQGIGAPIALTEADSWQMPMGMIPLNRKLCQLINQNNLVSMDENAHRLEHSLEVQLPFIQFHCPQANITPLVIGQIALDQCLNLAHDLAESIKEFNQHVLIVASTDMSHYISRERATIKDQLAIDEILDLNPAGLYQTVITNRISMCGFIPAVIALAAAIELGAIKAKLIDYSDSGEKSGDTEQVVGYAGLAIS